jgi:hypothetical protein
MKFSLWAKGSLESKRSLLHQGENRGLFVGPENPKIRVPDEIGFSHSAVILSASGKKVFVLEWEDKRNIYHVINL